MSTVDDAEAPQETRDALEEPLLATEEHENEPPTAEPQRQGTISSACFNMWSTMVGGGCLSLPLAFVKSGNALLAPVLLLLTAGLSYFCFDSLVRCSRWSGCASYEGIAASALGNIALQSCAMLVSLMCFFGICGYSVLLRDMLQPLTDGVFHHSDHDDDDDTSLNYVQSNALMFLVALLVTPICTLKTLTSLEKFGAASMSSIVLLGLCILFRSGQCLASGASKHTVFLRLFPESWKDVLDVIPLFISCYVCHYNIPAVMNELKDPTEARTKQWLHVTVIGSTSFYMLLGLSGSMYAMACHNGTADGNILLDFPEDDPLVFVGRMCLAMTIALAFPMLTIPARDILLRSVLKEPVEMEDEDDADSAAFDEPFLEQSLVDPSPFAPVSEEESSADNEHEEASNIQEPMVVSITTQPEAPSSPSLRRRLFAAILVFWTGVLLASVVESIDIVWDLLGSSLSIMLSYLIPAASFLILARAQRGMKGPKAISYGLLVVFTPLMFISTGNAIVNTVS